MDELSRETPIHALDTKAALARLGSRFIGLCVARVRQRPEELGPNRLPEPPRRSPLIRFVAQFNSALIYVLLAAAAVTLLLGHVIDTALIGVVAVILFQALLTYAPPLQAVFATQPLGAVDLAAITCLAAVFYVLVALYGWHERHDQARRADQPT